MLGNGIEAFDLRDDAAVLAIPAGGPLVVSVDSVVEGVHVDLSICSPGDVGWKALMGALSDLAAVGAVPLGALVALCVPGRIGRRRAGARRHGGRGRGLDRQRLFRGGGRCVASRTSSWWRSPCWGASSPMDPRRWRVVAPSQGTCCSSRDPAALQRRDCAALRARGGASADTIAASEAYRRPVARVREGQLSRAAGAHAMIDVSDGLALDLHRLADASGVGFELASIPIAPAATLDEALGGGEDYELIVAVDVPCSEQLAAAFSAAGLRAPVAFGTVTAESSTRTLGGRHTAATGVAAHGRLMMESRKRAGRRRRPPHGRRLRPSVSCRWAGAPGAAAWSPCRPGCTTCRRGAASGRR